MLGTIKCSTCNMDVDIAELGDHVCVPEKGLGLGSGGWKVKLTLDRRRTHFTTEETCSIEFPRLFTAG